MVDDVKSYLDNVGKEIRLEPFLSDSAEQTFEVLKSYPIKVLVTNQILGGMKGTQLVRNMRDELRLSISSILLTIDD